MPAATAHAPLPNSSTPASGAAERPPRNAGEAGLALYVHWPFCAAKCPYCDFNSHVRESVDQVRWARALIRDLEVQADRTPRRPLASIFFGGGTPSLMAPEVVGGVIDCARSLFGLEDGAEITLEANPTSVEAERFRGYREAGVNRLSMGIQALDDESLKRLGRLHTSAEARAAFDLARATFPRISFDLIYARPGQTPDDWRRELAQALAMAADHLSLYQLTIEPGTRFAELYRRGKLQVPDDAAAAALYEITQEVTAAAGLPAYEVSNHAAPGAEGRHNLVYWRHGRYLGVGPGAHGRIDVGGALHATEAHTAPEAWLDAVERLGHGICAEATIPPAEQAEEVAIMGLRLMEGISLRRYAALAGAPMSPRRLEPLLADGLVRVAGDTLSVTGKGRPLLNAILRDLLV
ncbi:radical SAM family heme chaperone HemW [Futiania mangrovi]|uniref:Heme chaperone HemW n=1 Tax=Futiania mangrovi TaxID=2959716 RepID=A0A9J6PF31_9PROT|nr:radical SAM family heme chaperone HemW [Futiania mangrovii]MCP1336395.1 radical SAM family heme chaperone HemW [Futiania mangrovii]